ncbi:MAG: XRE family transcriptional regulator [Dehalococcoidia bacterium]|nr:XRE family transcriptional regulator [Dehalococcoidia bacterium]
MEALITPTIIRWALERVRKPPEQVAQELSVTPDRFAAWANGELRPTLRQAQELAKKLRIPFGYLYLDDPPRETLPLPDLRTIKPEQSVHPSPDLMDVIHDALRKQEWYREQLQHEERPKVNFVGRYSQQDAPDQIARDIRDTLGINMYQRPHTSSWEAFLRYLIMRVENKGVLVLRSGIVGSDVHRRLDVREFLGFVISDKLAPLVFLNSNDYKTAQIFTLAHELAHLWIDQSGVLNPNYRVLRQKNEVETTCDNIAAETLVPGADFDLRWDESKSVDGNVSALAIAYRVSAFVVLRRAYSLNRISRAIFSAKYDALLQSITRRKIEDDGHYYSLVTSRNSHIFTHTLIGAVGAGLESPVEAARLLNVRVGTLRKIEGYIFSHA